MSNDNDTGDGLKRAHLLSMMDKKGISRRDFMQFAAAIGVITTAAAGLWSANVKATPKRGGHLRVGSEGGSNTDAIDPRRAIGTNQFTCPIMSMFDTLTYLDADGDPQPSLCESWEASADAVTWRFKIRKDIEFHNGKTMTPEDIVASYNYEDNDANTHGDSRSIMASIEEKTIDGDYVVFKLKSPNPDLPTVLTAYGLLIGPAGTETADWEKGIGTGPYMLDDFIPGVRFAVKRNPNHYRDDEGFFDSAEFLNIQDQASRTNALRTGEVDIINRPDPKTSHLLSKVPGIKLTVTAGNQHYTMPMRIDAEPFTNLDVRQAVKWGVDREAILDKILRGYGYLGNDHPIGQGQRYFNSELPQRVMDPEKAKFHLKKAGLSSLKLELFAADTAWVGSVDAAQLVQESAKQSSINIKVTRAAEDGYWADTWNLKPWCLSYWGGRATEDWMFTTAYWSESSWNETAMKWPNFDKLLFAARGELDSNKRQEQYFEMQRLLYEEGGACVPVFSSYVLAASDKLGHGKISTTYDFDTFRIARNFWLES